MISQGYKPPRNPHTFAAVMFTIAAWGLGIAAGVHTFLTFCK